jgi:hypothetical protein
MAYMMHIGFDNSRRLSRNVYYFEYSGTAFKLIQNNPRRWSDVLLTIVPDHNDETACKKAYLAASEFLSALSWQNDASVKLQHLGGGSAKTDLRRAKCHVFSFPQIPFEGLNKGYEIYRIPYIETEEQRLALTLFREARSANNDYLSFLFYWQVLEIGKKDPIGWVNKIHRTASEKVWTAASDLSRLPLSGKKLGNYFYDDCRTAISHIFRLKGGKRKIVVDSPEDNLRMVVGRRVVEAFAKLYIQEELGLSKHMYCVRRRGNAFPVYITEDEMRNVRCKLAYAPKYGVRRRTTSNT